MHSLHDPKLHDLSAFTDAYSLPLPDSEEEEDEDTDDEIDDRRAIPGAGDMELSTVCKLLYLNN